MDKMNENMESPVLNWNGPVFHRVPNGKPQKISGSNGLGLLTGGMFLPSAHGSPVTDSFGILNVFRKIQDFALMTHNDQGISVGQSQIERRFDHG